MDNCSAQRRTASMSGRSARWMLRRLSPLYSTSTTFISGAFGVSSAAFAASAISLFTFSSGDSSLGTVPASLGTVPAMLGTDSLGTVPVCETQLLARIEQLCAFSYAFIRESVQLSIMSEARAIAVVAANQPIMNFLFILLDSVLHLDFLTNHQLAELFYRLSIKFS